MLKRYGRRGFKLVDKNGRIPPATYQKGNIIEVRNDLVRKKETSMKQNEAYDLVCKEYLNKCKEYGCDSCIAENYCILNHLRDNNKCIDNLKGYLKQR